MPKPVWANTTEEAAWRERWCARCFQPDEAQHRITPAAPGCPLLAQGSAGRLPTQWTRRRNPVMGDTYRCSDYRDRPPVNRRRSAPAETEPMFDVEVQPRHLVPVDEWHHYTKGNSQNTPDKF